MGSWRAGSSNYFPFFLCFPWTHPHGVSVKLYTRTTVHGTEKQPLNQPIINFISLWETLPQTTFILPLLFTSNSGQEVMSVMSDFAGQASPQFQLLCLVQVPCHFLQPQAWWADCPRHILLWQQTDSDSCTVAGHCLRRKYWMTAHVV